MKIVNRKYPLLKHHRLHIVSIPMNTNEQLCLICGDRNAQSHYGAISCVSCKIFFRRNAQYDLNNNQCLFDGHCSITILTRRLCRHCRLKKCFDVGMERELLRSAHSPKSQLVRKKRTTKKSTTTKYTIQPLDLLEHDRSLLSTEQWSYFSNIIHLYDTTTPMIHVKNLIKEEALFPVKIRCKMAINNMLTIMTTMHESIVPFTQNIFQFKNLSSNDQAALIERNIKSLGGYSSIVIGRETDFCSSETFTMGFSLLYGSSLLDDVVRLNNRADNDSTLIKLLLAVLLFSMSSDLYFGNHEHESQNRQSMVQYRTILNVKEILNIQNFYVEILFKYMIYRYGENEAILRFAGLIKSAIDQSMCASRTTHVQNYDQLIHDVVKHTEQSLSLEETDTDMHDN